MIDQADLKKTALIACTTSALYMLWSYGDQVLVAGSWNENRLGLALALLPQHLFAIPWLVLLFLLYRTAIPVTISMRLRQLALVLVWIYGADVAFSLWTGWRRGIHQNLHSLHLASSDFWVRWYTSPAGVIVSDAIELGAMLASLAFLVALSRLPEAAPEPDARERRLVRRAALISVCARGVLLLFAILGAIYLYSQPRHGTTRFSAVSPLALARRFLFGLPGLFTLASVALSRSPPGTAPRTSAPPVKRTWVRTNSLFVHTLKQAPKNVRQAGNRRSKTLVCNRLRQGYG